MKSGDWDIFVLKYSKDGAILSGSTIGGPGFNKANGISLDDSGNVYLIGFFSQQASLGQITLKTDPANGSGFIAKYHE